MEAIIDNDGATRHCRRGPPRVSSFPVTGSSSGRDDHSSSLKSGPPWGTMLLRGKVPPSDLSICGKMREVSEAFCARQVRSRLKTATLLYATQPIGRIARLVRTDFSGV